MAVETIPISVVETREFERQASRFFTFDELETLKVHLAYNRLAGVVIPGTGGVRKLRWAMPGRGKRGGARVICYDHGRDVPLYLFSTYAKAVTADLTPAESVS